MGKSWHEKKKRQLMDGQEETNKDEHQKQKNKELNEQCAKSNKTVINKKKQQSKKQLEWDKKS
jgi:hypothetical protein